jgi:dolichol kinase
MAIDVLKGFIYLVVMYISALLIVLAIRKLRIIPTEIIRKAFHITCAMSVYLLMYTSKSWQVAALVALSFIVVVYPILTVLEHTASINVSRMNVQRRGQIKFNSCLPYDDHPLCSLLGMGRTCMESGRADFDYGMGYGDAAAALIGKRFGRNFINVPGLISANSGRHICYGRGFRPCNLIHFVGLCSVPLFLCLLLAVLVSPICAGVELVSHRGIDTLTVPLSAATAISLVILSIQSFGG